MDSTEEITVLINAVRDLSEVGICYYDLKEFFHYDKYGVKNNRGHYCEFCKKARTLPNGRAQCEKSDRYEAIELAKQYKEPFFFECHMGMRELIVPLWREKWLMGVVFVGQCRFDETYDEVIRTNASKMGGNPDEYLKLYRQLPVISPKNLMNIANILEVYFRTKILNNELLTNEPTSQRIGEDLPVSMRHFIRDNFRYHLSLREIADTFHVNASYASRRFSQRFHVTVTEYITSVRIEHAKMLLLSTEAPIGNITLNIGFEDVNYFSRTFKKRVGCSPGQFRRNHRLET